MATSETMVGAVLNGKWRLTKLLGEGGMGAVFAADSMQGQGQRAIKVLHPEFINEPQILDRFFKEAVAAQQLQHPNVATVYEHAQAEDGSPYLVMELLSGIPLSEYVQPGKPMQPNQAAPIVYGVLQALMAAHAQNIVHRDLKPDNIFLVPDPSGRFNVKVLDFGIAKVMDAAGGMGSKTRTGVMLGTPGYMSPEQIKNAKGVDPRSDLWSVGIIFYEMLTGQEAFEAATDFARLTAVLTQEPKPISQVAPHLVGWQDFFSKAIAREADRRFATADEMARALIGTARAVAGAQMLPTAEFKSVAIASQSQPQPPSPLTATAKMEQLPRRDGSSTHLSPQMPETAPHVRPPPSVQVVVPPAAPAPRPAKTGVKPVWVAVVGVVCAIFGFGAGFLAAYIVLSMH